MRTVKVSDLMVPLSRCPRISPAATLLEAALAIESCGDPCACLVVLDEAGRAGLFEAVDYLKGLEPRYAKDDLFANLQDAQYYGDLARETIQSLGLFSAPMKHLCAMAAQRQVNECVRRSSKEQVIAAEDSLDVAIHQFAMTGRQALLVLEGDKPAGLLKLGDVFRAVLQKAKSCPKD